MNSLSGCWLADDPAGHGIGGPEGPSLALTVPILAAGVGQMLVCLAVVRPLARRQKALQIRV